MKTIARAFLQIFLIGISWFAIFPKPAMAGPDTQTLTPILTLPASNSTYTGSLPMSYVLPENPAPGTVRIFFLVAATPYANLDMSISTNVSITINPFSSTIVDSAINSTSGFPLSPGTYDVMLVYQDVFLNPVASATSTNIVIQAATPTMTPTPVPTATPCTSNAALPRVKIHKRTATVALSVKKATTYSVTAAPVGSPTRRSKRIRFTAQSNEKRSLVFEGLKAGNWSFSYTTKSKGGLVLSCAVEKSVS